MREKEFNGGIQDGCKGKRDRQRSTKEDGVRGRDLKVKINYSF